MILIPEHPFDIEDVCRRPPPPAHATGRRSRSWWWPRGPIPQEGTLDLPEHELDENGFPRLGGVANHIAPEIEKRHTDSRRG